MFGILGSDEMFGFKRNKVNDTALNYDTQVELIFPAELFLDPNIAPLLEKVGIKMEASGNKVILFTDPRTVAVINADDKIKKLLQSNQFGVVLYGWNQQERTSFLARELNKIENEWAGNDEVLRRAVFDLHRFVCNGLLGQIDPNPFAAPLPPVSPSEKFDLAAALEFLVSPEQMNKPKAPDHLRASQLLGKR